jgi:hypothetical protein
VCQVNILIVIGCVGSWQVPLYWELLENKSGNSSTKDRITLLEKIVGLAGVGQIGILIADREFIGNSWLKYLKDNKIHFCIRVPKSHYIVWPCGRQRLVSELATKNEQYFTNCLVDGVVVNI